MCGFELSQIGRSGKHLSKFVTDSLVVTSSDCDSATRLRMRVGGVENGECLMLFVVCPQQVFVFMRSLLERGECKMTLSCPELLNGTRLLFELFRYVCWD